MGSKYYFVVKCGAVESAKEDLKFEIVMEVAPRGPCASSIMVGTSIFPPMTTFYVDADLITCGSATISKIRAMKKKKEEVKSAPLHIEGEVATSDIQEDDTDEDDRGESAQVQEAMDKSSSGHSGAEEVATSCNACKKLKFYGTIGVDYTAISKLKTAAKKSYAFIAATAVASVKAYRAATDEESEEYRSGKTEAAVEAATVSNSGYSAVTSAFAAHAAMTMIESFQAPALTVSLGAHFGPISDAARCMFNYIKKMCFKAIKKMRRDSQCKTTCSDNEPCVATSDHVQPVCQEASSSIFGFKKNKGKFCMRCQSQGNACDGDQDCASGVCNSGKCMAVGLRVGEACKEDDQCVSNDCRKKVCSAGNLGAGESCRVDSQCSSGKCSHFIGKAGACRVSDSQVCEATKKSKNRPAGCPCSKDKQCAGDTSCLGDWLGHAGACKKP